MWLPPVITSHLASYGDGDYSDHINMTLNYICWLLTESGVFNSLFDDSGSFLGMRMEPTSLIRTANHYFKKSVGKAIQM